jgi:hypothetical protein
VTDTSLIGRDGRTHGRVCPAVAVTTLGTYAVMSTVVIVAEELQYCGTSSRKRLPLHY